MALGVLLVGAILLLPGLGRTPFGDLDLIYVIPTWMTAFAAWRIRGGASSSRTLRTCIVRLRISGMMLAGLSPFLSWWTRCGDSSYLALNAAYAVCFGVWHILEVLMVVRIMACDLGLEDIATMAKRAQSLVVFCLIVPILAFILSFALSLLVYPTTVLADLRESWATVPGVFRCIIIIPVLNVGRVLWTAHRFLAHVAGQQGEAGS
ncbi:MAG: hypothetical protein KAI66_08230 [Lentisphaeria bacterium]|nr:hypothetical protein [Lentisphaeria bacterium]